MFVCCIFIELFPVLLIFAGMSRATGREDRLRNELICVRRS